MESYMRESSAHYQASEPAALTDHYSGPLPD